MTRRTSTRTVQRRRVQSDDVDASGAMHFARYPAFMEAAILDRLEELGAGLAAFRDRSLDLVVSALGVDYQEPARLREEVGVIARVERVGSASVEASARVIRQEDGEEETLAAGDLRLAVVSRSKGEPEPIPEEFRRRLGDAV